MLYVIMTVGLLMLLLMALGMILFLALIGAGIWLAGRWASHHSVRGPRRTRAIQSPASRPH